MFYAETKQIEAQEAYEVFCAMKKAVEKSEQFELKKADETSGQLYITRGMSLKSFGERIYVSILPDTRCFTSVFIRSELKWGLVDYGRNNENLVLLCNMLKEELKQ